MRPFGNHSSFLERTIIIGAGHFGERAVGILIKMSQDRSPFLIVDRDGKRLSAINHPLVKSIEQDGINFLVRNFEALKSSNVIIPAVPLHLAAEWLKKRLKNGLIIKPIRFRKR